MAKSRNSRPRCKLDLPLKCASTHAFMAGRFTSGKHSMNRRAWACSFALFRKSKLASTCLTN
eukprot:5762390-Amphidinium_carterae.1